LALDVQVDASQDVRLDPINPGRNPNAPHLIGLLARAMGGHAAAAPPSRLMNSRRFN
jgi:hypothetical protein